MIKRWTEDGSEGEGDLHFYSDVKSLWRSLEVSKMSQDVRLRRPVTVENGQSTTLPCVLH